MDDFEKLAYPNTVIINGEEYKASRNTSKGSVKVPYNEAPDIGIGDTIIEKSGNREIHLRVLDLKFLPGGTLHAGTNHPNLLTLDVHNITAEPHQPQKASSSVTIGSIQGNQVQVGDHNVQIEDINIKQLVEHVANSNDPEAKSKLKELLNNSTVASLIGAGVSSLAALL